MKAKQGGFTLIELLVVVAIIGILAGIILVGVGGALSKGRDSRRIAELRQIQNALELYRAKNALYPNVANFAAMKTALEDPTSGVVRSGAIPTGVTPPAGNAYLYGTTGGNTYTLGVLLENADNPQLATSIKGTSDGLNCATPTYCVSL